MFEVLVVCYTSYGELTVGINGERYLYDEVSPYAFERFRRMLRRNKGRALAYLKRQSRLVKEKGKC